MEGTQPQMPRAADLMQTGVPTCLPTEPLAEIRARVQGTDWEQCVVIDADRCVLGLIRFPDESGDPEAPAIEAMQIGPTTKRPDEPLGPLVERMRDRNVRAILITTPEGKLLGLLDREEAEQHLEHEGQTLTWEDCEGCRGTPIPRP